VSNTATIFPVFVFFNLLLGLVLSLALGWASIAFARRVGLMDIPGSLPHKIHGTPTALAGGLTLVLSLAIGGLIFNFSMMQDLWKVFLPAMIVFIVGLWDDFRRLPARIKLAGQVAASVLLIYLGTTVHFVPHHFLGLLPGHTNIWADWFITLVWMVGITNAFNFVDSMDGLVAGLSGIAVSFLVLVTIASPQQDLLRLLTLMLGVCAGLFFSNTTPARLFFGDSGSQTMGFLLAAIGILYTPVNYPQASSWFLPIIIFGVPIFDTCLVVFSRLRRRMPIYQAERNHTYHRLVDRGLDTNRAVMVMQLAAIALGCLAFIALNLPSLYSNLLFGLVCLVGLGSLVYLEKKTP
jgi:UDP-GlcNAc:undecaprenyl-phosphate GlcNAc-1-phosphate transferase